MWHQLPPRYEKKFRWYLAFVLNIVTTFGSLAVMLFLRYSAHLLERYAHSIDGDDRSLLIGVQTIVTGASLAVAIWGLFITSAHMILLHDLRRPDDPLRTAAFIYVTVASVLVVVLISSASLTLRLVPLVAKATTTMTMALRYYMKRPHVRRAVDVVQYELNCCGNVAFDEWFRVPWSNDSWVLTTGSLAVPSSCCDRQLAADHLSTCRNFVESMADVGLLTPSARGCLKPINDLFGNTLKVSAVLLFVLASLQTLTVLLVFLTFGVSHTHSPDDGHADIVDSSSRRSKTDNDRGTASSKRPHHLAAVGRLVNLVVGHQSHVRKQNTLAKSANDIPEHDVVDLVKMIRATAAPATTRSDDDGEEGDDESTRLLPATTSASRVGRRRSQYRPMSARNVLTLTRLARLMKGGGEGGTEGLASEKLPHVGEVLSAIDRMTSKRIDDNNRDQTTGSESASANDDGRDNVALKTDSRHKKQQIRKIMAAKTKRKLSSSLSRNPKRAVGEPPRLRQPRELITASISASDVVPLATSRPQHEASRNPTTTTNATLPSVDISRSATSKHRVDRLSGRRSARRDVLNASTTGTHAGSTSVVPDPSPYEKRSLRRSGVPHASSEPPMSAARSRLFAVGTDTGHARTFAATPVHRHPGSPAAIDRSQVTRSPDTGTGPMTLDK